MVRVRERQNRAPWFASGNVKTARVVQTPGTAYPVFAPMKWQDWASFFLGAWLAASPWLLGFSGAEAATANTALTGLALAALALFDLWLPEQADERLGLIAGLWLTLAPFVLGYSAELAPTLNSIACGVSVALLAAGAMALEKDLGKWWHDHVTGH